MAVVSARRKSLKSWPPAKAESWLWEAYLFFAPMHDGKGIITSMQKSTMSAKGVAFCLLLQIISVSKQDLWIIVARNTSVLKKISVGPSRMFGVVCLCLRCSSEQFLSWVQTTFVSSLVRKVSWPGPGWASLKHPSGCLTCIICSPLIFLSLSSRKHHCLSQLRYVLHSCL